MYTGKAMSLVDLLQENMVLRAEVASLAELLDVAQEIGEVPADWRSLLKDARQTQKYLNIAEQYESLFKKLRDVTDKSELETLLEEVEPAILTK